MEPDAGLRSRGQGTYLHAAAAAELAADDGIAAELRWINSYLFAEFHAHTAAYLASTPAATARGFDGQEETASIRDGFLLRHGAGLWRNGVRVDESADPVDREHTSASTSQDVQFQCTGTGIGEDKLRQCTGRFCGGEGVFTETSAA